MNAVAGATRVMNRPRLLAMGLPIALFLTTTAVFLGLTSWLGKPTGYILGFLFYWVFWCLLVPRFILGKRDFYSLLTDRIPLFTRINWSAALLFLVITVVTLFMYLSGFLRATWILLLFSVPCATIDGVCEEILWRGTYVRVFDGKPLVAVFYAALGFAVWHFVPQMVFPAATGAPLFVLSTFLLGVSYGFIAYRTGSAKWTAISHSLSGVGSENYDRSFPETLTTSS